MKKPRIVLDVDGVLCDFQTPALDTIERLTGRRPSVDVYDFLEGFADYEKADCWAAMNERGFCEGLNPYPGARAFVDDLRKLGRVVFATAPMRGLTWEGERRRWIVDHMGAAWGDVASVPDKTLVSGEAFIDDHPEHVRDWRAHHDGLALLFDRPFNRAADDLRHVRAADYAEAIWRVTTYLEGKPT